MPLTSCLPSSSFTPSRVSRIDFGWPGRLMIRLLPRITPTCRDRIAVGTKCRLIWRICSPKPGITLSATATVASGVTSRRAGPVPPVVRIRWQASRSASSFRVVSICARSSGIRRETNLIGLMTARESQSLRAGSPSSWYTPCEARSLIDTRPTTSCSVFVVISLLLRASASLQSQRRVLDHQLAQRLKQRPRAFRRLARCSFLQRVADERAQPLQVRRRKAFQQLAQRSLVLEQTVAPALGLVQPRGLSRGVTAPTFDLSPNPRRVRVAHQPADVLQLSATRAPLDNAPCLQHRLAQRLGQIEAGQPLRRQPDQRLAEFLQLMHLALALRLADL